MSNDNVGIGETRGVSQFSIYIYIWGELRVLRVLLPLKNFYTTISTVSKYSFARFSNFFDVNFYFIRVIQLFVSDIIYLFFFYITRRFKLKFVARFEFLCSTEFSRDYKIYVFMNIYFKKKIALQYILIFTLNAITDTIKFCTRLVFEIIVATFSNILSFNRILV